MYLVSEEFLEQIKADNREFSVALTFNSSTELTGTTIQSISVDEVVNSTDALTLGCACSNKITVNLINPPTDIQYESSYFTAKVGLKVGTEYEDVPLGKFYVTSSETTNDFKNLTITAYDGFCKMTGVYSSTLGGNTTLQAVYDDLKAQLGELGITLKDRVLPEYSITFANIENITYQQAIGYVAGCLGGFARFDRNGDLEIATYTDSGVIIDRNLQYLNGFKRITDQVLNVTSIATGTKEKPIVRGEGANGTEINFENPYITDAMADDVYADFLGLEYTPCQVKWRGNPAIQAGDIVEAVDKNGEHHTVLVMSQNIKIGGGLNSIIDCKGKGETTANFSNSFETTGQKIERYYKTLEQQILDATKAITGNKGGYLKINDTNGDGSPDEITVSDLSDLQFATSVWRWNQEGFGYAYKADGGAYKDGSYRMAFTPDGKINADMIATGTLNADLVRIGDQNGNLIYMQDGIIHFELANSPLSMKLGNFSTDPNEPDYQLAIFNGSNRIAYFSSNSFELENITNGRVRIQDFGFLPRESGNLTFTKLT